MRCILRWCAREPYGARHNHHCHRGPCCRRHPLPLLAHLALSQLPERKWSPHAASCRRLQSCHLRSVAAKKQKASRAPLSANVVSCLRPRAPVRPHHVLGQPHRSSVAKEPPTTTGSGRPAVARSAQPASRPKHCATRAPFRSRQRSAGPAPSFAVQPTARGRAWQQRSNHWAANATRRRRRSPHPVASQVGVGPAPTANLLALRAWPEAPRSSLTRLRTRRLRTPPRKNRRGRRNGGSGRRQ